MPAPRHLLRAVLAGATLALPPLATAQAPRAADAPEAVIPLVPHRTRWALEVTVGGRPFHFGLDTGGGVTLISPEVARAAGCTPWGRLSGFQMMGQRLDSPRCDGVAIEVGGRRYVPDVAAVIPVTAVEPNDRNLDGSLALDAFAGRAVTLELAAGRLTVESPGSLAARVRDMTPLPIHVQREMGGRALAVTAAVPTAKGTLWMELDSGNGGTVLVSKPYAALLGLDSTAAGPQRGEFAVLPAVHVRSDRLFTPDMVIDGNLGMPFLRRWVITLDLASARAWIAPAND